ncbi:SUMF1/EgtB/PvdO family nonheme iron enzyme [Zwartia sp.]|uniref:SUMF1/EgtB/PvdO family nonheme iron enzyme n=1 Tax=Zwartia sp. TaxID=2978004 RepID=UPI0027158BEA|nr:SUMF1/EgtB/PvdO family nonheme iron enzyme [Zwartia sp.]MDO9024793.1 SUMF1/EgtB/PvdO family nonheme iron enzyme [Zwartia sp.]
MRQAKVNILAQGLSTLRQETLSAFEYYRRSSALAVPHEDEFNPPLWELGHLAWFQEYWIARNQQRDLGVTQDIHHSRLPSKVPQADQWYDSARVSHALRWSLPLLSTQPCLDYLQQTLHETLSLLKQEKDNSSALYFYWLALQHEAMHLEASTYMAQSLGIPFTASWAVSQPLQNSDAESQPPQLGSAKDRASVQRIPSTQWTMGNASLACQSQDFYFDNEVGQRVTALEAYSIALTPVTWSQYMRFVEATGHRLPLYVRAAQLQDSLQPYEINLFGKWVPLNPEACAQHISWDDAQAYCRWAHCRLPTEAEWDCGARTLSDFKWGEVWEWTADTFEPFEGFTPHPYVEYSAPWFGSRKVLRGAAWATHPYLRDLNYRNFFTPDRRDIYAGFRVCL